MDSFLIYIDLLNDELKKSLRFYTSSEYKELNQKVREGIILDKELKIHYDNISDIFDGAPTLKKPITVYRGMTKKYTNQFKNQGFISASLNKDVAKTFHKGSSCCLYIITLTPGEYGILPLDNVSEMPDEQEVLLPPGSLSIQSIVPYSENKENVDIVYCTYIPENAIIINSIDINSLNDKQFKKTKISLSTESWVNRILESNMKEEIQLLCEDTGSDLNKCILEQLKTLDFYDDIPMGAIDKFMLLFNNLSDNLVN